MVGVVLSWSCLPWYWYKHRPVGTVAAFVAVVVGPAFGFAAPRLRFALGQSDIQKDLQAIYEDWKELSQKLQAQPGECVGSSGCVACQRHPLTDVHPRLALQWASSNLLEWRRGSCTTATKSSASATRCLCDQSCPRRRSEVESPIPSLLMYVAAHTAWLVSTSLRG